MSILVKRLGLGVVAQTIAGLCFALSSYLVGRGAFFPVVAAVSWTPWVLWAVIHLVSETERKIGALVACSLIIAMQLLSGHAQTSWYTLVLAVLWGSFIGYEMAYSQFRAGANSGTPHFNLLALSVILKAWAWLGLAVLVAAALAAVQLLLTAEYLAQSQRSGAVDYKYAMTYSYWPWRLVTWLAPAFFGTPVSGDYWGYGNFWEDALYIGMAPILLAISTAWRGLFGREKAGKSENQLRNGISVNIIDRDFVIFLVGIVVVSMVLALGKNTPVFPWLYTYIPTFDMFQAPTRFSLLAEVCLVVLAGFGVETWLQPVGRRLYWTRLGTAGAVAVAIGAGLAWVLLPEIKLTMIRAAATAGLWAAGAGVLSLSARKNQEDEVKPGWAVALIAMLSLDLLVAHAGLNPLSNRSLYRQEPVTIAGGSQVATRGRIYLSASDEYKLKFGRYFSFKKYDNDYPPQQVREALLPNTNLLEGISSANNFDPLVPGRFQRWMEGLEISSPGQADALLNLMGVGVVMKLDSESVLGVKSLPREEGQRLRFFDCAVQVMGGEEAWQEVSSGSLDLEQVLVLENDAGVVSSCTSEANSPRIETLLETSSQLVASVQTERPGWLMVSDVWYPGWRADVDDRATPVLRADYLFRAVAVPAGEHRVTFSYQPASFRWGSVISLLAMTGLLIASLRSKRS